MKKNGFVVSVLVVCLLGACVSLQDRPMTHDERATTDVTGTVSAKFTTWQWFHIPNKTSIKEKAYSELKKAAAQEYGGNVEVQNITISGGFSPLSLINISLGTGLTIVGAYELGDAVLSEPGWNNMAIQTFQENRGMSYTGIPNQGQAAIGGALLGGGLLSLLIGNPQTIIATGDVVQLNAETGAKQAIQRALSGAMKNVSLQLIEALPQKSTIAVLSIESNDKALSENAVGELELNLVNSGKFTIVERKRLDQIRQEKDLQLSEDVSDDSAVEIGHELGANIVLVGTITTTGLQGQIIIRAWDIKTTQIVTMARGQF
ncbi:hypothetical protein AGMMS49546_34630 [Spirochaetia bacterium]|nr:hypothetical protein AGMMS49546_34630 [Spirochaetia bacterium]